jgi:hypothetical protein
VKLIRHYQMECCFPVHINFGLAVRLSTDFFGRFHLGPPRRRLEQERISPISLRKGLQAFHQELQAYHHALALLHLLGLSTR